MSKPVIDMAAVVRNLGIAGRLADLLANIGYAHHGEFGLPGRHFFTKTDEPDSFHLHVVEAGSDRWWRYIAFRDALRREPELRAAYVSLKLKLAAEFANNPDGYSRAKSDFINQALTEHH
jgi:GrpB-like predicted nucleotidyltransferase (UPF0157 family)